MPSISPPSDAATLFDGLSARPQRVEVAFGGATLVIAHADGRAEPIDAALLARARDGAGGRAVLRRADIADWRLTLDAPADWAETLPRADATPRRHTARYAAAIVATIAVVAGLWLGGGALLEAAAPLVPAGVSDRVGRSVAAQLGADTPCSSPAGDAALARLTARVGGPPATVVVARGPIVNAFAAPGGRVVLFEGLIAKARSPDEVAGVLAHELAHVAGRHPEQAMIRYFGLSLAAGALGGDIGAVADLAALFANTRDKERAADAGGVALLRAAAIDPAGLAVFLGRVDEDEGGPDNDRLERIFKQLGDYAGTHPGGRERSAAIRAGGPPPGATPALSAADWRALRAICAAPKPRAT